MSKPKPNKVSCPRCLGIGCDGCGETGIVPFKDAVSYTKEKDEERRKHTRDERTIIISTDDLITLKSGSSILYCDESPIVRIKLSTLAIEAIKDATIHEWSHEVEDADL